MVFGRWIQMMPLNYSSICIATATTTELREKLFTSLFNSGIALFGRHSYFNFV